MQVRTGDLGPRSSRTPGLGDGTDWQQYMSRPESLHCKCPWHGSKAPAAYIMREYLGSVKSPEIRRYQKLWVRRSEALDLQTNKKEWCSAQARHSLVISAKWPRKKGVIAEGV